MINRRKINQRLNNVTHAMMVAQELARIRAGNGRLGFSESAQGKLMFMGRDRGRPRTRKVLPLESRDAAFQAVLDTHVHPGLARFHQLVEKAIGRHKAAYWYCESTNNQLHARTRIKSIVRPVTSHQLLGHL